MVSISSDMLQAWVSGLLWPLTRILALIAVAPIFNHTALPARFKLVLGVFITLAIMPSLPPVPDIDMLSIQGAGVLVQQIIIGVSIGFIMRILFAAISMAGHISAMSMGLGFASFYDPQTQGQTTSVSQIFMIIAMLFFLSIDGHLMMIMAISESFVTMPVSLEITSGINFLTIVTWGGSIFSAGLHMALPVVTALLITNLALGILSRTAPQLNLFGIGFPITISIGLVVIALTLPRLSVPLERLISDGFGTITSITAPAR
ncbi:Flagellar biosynthetic protein FliR [Methylophilaceae bacterium]|nr:Flagellar biosynthetic protein FliR [Methylophilaceae bacterium]